MEAVGLFFRKHPELEPTGKLSILGRALCSAQRMNAYVKRRNPKAPQIAELYLQAGRRYGVRGDVAFCQMVYESRCWSNEFSGPSWGPFSLAQRGEEASIAVHMQLLYTMASDIPLSSELDTSDRRVDALVRSGWQGSAHCWEDLNGKWSIGVNRYGQDVVAMWRNLMEWSAEEEEEAVDNENTQQSAGLGSLMDRVTRRVDWSLLCSEEMNWLKDQRLLPEPVPHPDRKVTWAELAAVLYRWEKRQSADTIERKEGTSKKEG
ncbi:hypothetical protein SD71_18825 [Cohnella kolymensis]|uniref:GH15-like domain-containing protein n=1 Tax=Cohnella kolymensis TaxID=1590652 RepID=A0ABR5A1I2_9BACL|nr:glucosaminidase domain-containing protein [Cohnella kolymensis]KIL34538.1 hypothetical protein SD71_18825 [Cohnella kolymensis]